LALLALAPLAQAQRPVLNEHVIGISALPQTAPEGACGLALAGEAIYVSSYFEHLVYKLEPGEEPKEIAADPLDGPCQLALGPGGELYANDYHRRVERLLPSPLVFPGAEATGLAVDPATGNVYVDERTRVSVYSPAGVLQQTIGQGSLEDGYGLALFAGRLYVPDAASATIKVYEPAVDIANPVQEIDGAATPRGRFNSLVDAVVAVDPGDEHVLVLDNLQPGFEAPEAAIEEFDTDGGFLGEVSRRVLDGEPSAMVFRGGKLLITSGNNEGSRVFEFGPYEAAPAFAPLAAPPPAIAPQSSGPAAAGALPAAVPAGTEQSGAPATALQRRRAKAKRRAARHRHWPKQRQGPAR
jgi:DNA-binding beta-propeller fold protein YncE